MKTEVSAGGIVVRRGESGWDVLLMKDMNNTWTFPKGLIDPGETPEQAAIREIAEETGLSGVTIIAPLQEVSYWYTRGERIHKTVHYFLCLHEGTESPRPQTDEGVSEVRWVPIADAHAMVGYPKTNPELLARAETRLASPI